MPACPPPTFLVLLLLLPAESTIDINAAAFQYIADRLTLEECHRLVAALHFRNFDLPREINSAERRLPDDVSCLDLLLHWNSTPKEGKGQTHVEVCHRLNQLGREDLAQWLSKTIFHQLSKDVRAALNPCRTEETATSHTIPTEVYVEEEVSDEAAWWTIDSFLAIFIVCGSGALIVGSFVVCILVCARKCKHDYKKLPTREK